METKALPEARRKLRDFKSELVRIDPEARSVTLEEMSDKYLLTIQHQAPKTKNLKRAVCDRIRTTWPGGARRAIHRIKASEARQFLSLYPGTSRHRQALEVVKTIFKMAVADGMIGHSPIADLKQRKRQKPIRSAPSIEEFQKIVNTIREQPFSDTAQESADFVEFLGLAGLGQTEASALRWVDVNFDKNQFITFRQKTRTGFAVPIFPQLRPLLEKRLTLAKGLNGGTAPLPEARVFSIMDAKKAIASACSRLSLSAYSSRAFRRMFITDALERVVDVKVIAQWQGH